MNRKNVILGDCEIEEILDFKNGLEDELHEEFEIKTKICNGKRSFFKNVQRYCIYATFPLKYFFNRKKYKYIIGWQQFFTLFFAFYCKVFHVKKQNIVIACNFTYKSKNSIIGEIYKKFIRYIIDSKYLDYLHVLSKDYAFKCSKEFNVPIEKFIVTHFGLPDLYNKWKNQKCEYEDFCLAIGRSNRDYEFLINAWNEMPRENKLLIICDQLKNINGLSENIIIRRDIVGESQFKYIVNCKAMIVPIKDGSICSGDTVLLKAMSFCKPVFVTIPSTLAEMYIENGVNGFYVEKDNKKFVKTLKENLKNVKKMENIGKEARMSFLNKYSREKMGNKIGKLINISL